MGWSLAADNVLIMLGGGGLSYCEAYDNGWSLADVKVIIRGGDSLL